MDIESLIIQLKGSKLRAECPNCEGEFNLSKAVLFDGTKPFPKNAQEVQEQLQEELKDREEELKTKKNRATKTATNTTIAVNVGKNLEKVLPTLKDFKWALPDSRFLGDPIDLIIFNGLSSGKVNSISFIEAKSGNARLNQHQKSVKDAIEDKKVSYRVIR